MPRIVQIGTDETDQSIPDKSTGHLLFGCPIVTGKTQKIDLKSQPGIMKLTVTFGMIVII